MSRLLRIIRRYWVPLFLAACAAYLVINAQELIESGQVVKPTSPELLLLALIIQAAVWLSLASGWRQVVLRFLGRRYALPEALVHFALFSFGKYLPGKVWGAAARAVNMGHHGVGTTESIEATLQEQFLVLHSAAIVSSVLLPILFPGWITWAIAMLVIASGAFGGRLANHILPVISKLLGRESRPRRKLTIGESVLLVSYYGAAWLLHGAVLVTICASLWGGFAELAPTTMGLLVLGNTIAMVAGFAAVFAPAGLGVREAVMAGIFASGMPMHEAVALSIAMRLWTIGTDLALGGIVLLTRRQG